jgi:Tol biopolymer transport system component
MEIFRFLGVATDERQVLIAKKADTTDQSQTPAETEIYAVSIDKGSMRKIYTISNVYFNNIQLSRDGRMIAFVSRSRNNTELWTVPAAGGPPKKILTENDPKIMFSTVAWSPDGSSVAFGKQTRGDACKKGPDETPSPSPRANPNASLSKNTNANGNANK